MLKSFTIQDDLAAQDAAAVEVVLELASGERRWCFFMTPAALTACGDFIPGTTIRYHHGAPHMIVVAGHLNRPLIEKVLHELAEGGELIRCSLPVEESLV
jgi:hypothetical protein